MSDQPTVVPEEAAEAADPKPRECYWIPYEQHDENGWIPSVVTEGEPGHHVPLKGNGRHAAPWYWGRTYEEAMARAAEENAKLGITPQQASEIVLSSMAAVYPS